MNWQKRACPISIKLVPHGAGWEDVTIDIQGNEHCYAVSGCIGDGFGALVESLYVLYPHQNYHRLEGRYLSKPVQAEFLWDEEGYGVSWTLTRTENEDREFSLVVHLDEWDDYCEGKKNTGSYNYTVSYSDMCYAVGKALTEAMKSHGFTGFHESVWESDINVRHLCFLKAYGMGKPDAVCLFESAEKGAGAVSSFKDEIELLLFDM